MADNENVNKIIEYNQIQKKNFKLKTQREIYSKIKRQVNLYGTKSLPNLLFLIGLRSTGKTTIMGTILQEYGAIYTSGDFLDLNKIDLDDVINVAKTSKTKIVLVDEIQYIKNWQLKLKVLVDLNPDILFLISGSSALNTSDISADLIRRSRIYIIEPLSFREYLLIKNNFVFEDGSLINEILFSDKNNNEKFVLLSKFYYTITKELKKEFEEYMKSSFPFMLTNYDSNIIKEIIYKVIYVDIPKIGRFNTENIDTLKKIIHFIAIAERTSITNLSKNTGTSKSMILKFLILLEKARIIYSVESANPTKRLGDAKKYVLYSPNFRFALIDTEKTRAIGFSKEDFFVSVIRTLNHPIKYFYEENKYDFLVNRQIFEIGSLSKKPKKHLNTNVIIIYNGELRFDGSNLYVPIELFALII
ncbi:MAG: hypothetical protein COT14_04040 [Candidatus Diapherotrites archaeon CG08_land_8_20_14_0_20_30_16]|nr:MAG: hypothetical protein COT14_04040 [Candidatus Diapherotrites archaeon CG08_land_8_20_14_0_20_30_16]